MKHRVKIGAVIAAAMLVFAPMAASATDNVCTPTEAWTETIIDQEHVPAVPAVPARYEMRDHMGVAEETHTEYQRYSWTGGPIEGAPTTVPPGDDWQANTSNYKGKNPVNVAYTTSKPGKANWFYWTANEIVDVEGIPAWSETVLVTEAIPAVPAVEEVSHTVEHEAVTCSIPWIPLEPANPVETPDDSIPWIPLEPSTPIVPDPEDEGEDTSIPWIPLEPANPIETPGDEPVVEDEDPVVEEEPVVEETPATDDVTVVEEPVVEELVISIGTPAVTAETLAEVTPVVADTAKPDALATTGGNAWGAGLTALALALTGGATMLIRRKA